MSIFGIASKRERIGDKDIARLPEHSASSPLSVHSMTVAYNQRPVLWDVEYDAPSNALIAVVGPNGAGKSTFIKACLQLVPKVSGAVSFWGEDYRKVRKKVGYVPQRETVDWDFPVSVLDVVCMGRYGHIGWCKPVTRKHKEIALQHLDSVGMIDFANRQITQLSGGQQQRVFLARALAQEATLYFMDEPFAGVDATTEKAIVEILRNLRDNNCTVICVHHDLPTVKDYFDHVLLMNTHVIANGPTADVFTPENLQKTYGGRLTLLDEAAQALSLGRKER
ncbi:MAG: ABC transporter ATP-binding protein [Deltaproteobacteria bacterium]|nr:ABC transporter ATP-binding protein [Deltaproteobacteria bacterium]